MIETGSVPAIRGVRDGSRGRARRAHDVLDEYDRGGVLSEQLEDELCSELTGLWPRSRQGRGRPARPGPVAPRVVPTPPRPGGTLPTRSVDTLTGARARLTLVHSVDRLPERAPRRRPR